MATGPHHHETVDKRLLHPVPQAPNRPTGQISIGHGFPFELPFDGKNLSVSRRAAPRSVCL